MKKIVFFLFVSLAFFSCEGNYDKKHKEVAGVWNIQKISYFDGTQIQTKEGDLGKIVFGKTTFGATEYNRDEGLQIIDGKEFKFEHSFSFSSSAVDIAFPREIREQLPIAGIGRVQVYKFDWIGDNKLRIFTDKEFDYTTNKVFENVSFILVR